MAAKQSRRLSKRKPTLKNFDFHLYGPIPRSLGISVLVLVCGIFGLLGYSKLQNSSAASDQATSSVISESEQTRSNSELYVYGALSLIAGSFLYWVYRQNVVKRY